MQEEEVPLPLTKMLVKRTWKEKPRPPPIQGRGPAVGREIRRWEMERLPDGGSPQPLRQRWIETRQRNKEFVR
jgi:hypothetical protein